MTENRTPVIVDTELAELYVQHAQLVARTARDDLYLIRLAGGTERRNYRDVPVISVDEALERGPVNAASYEIQSWIDTVANRAERIDEVDTITARWDVLEDEWRRAGRWSRFFLVKNANGHIHSSLNCSTCYPTTEYAWLPALSGLSEADAVEDQGSILCSVCFPSAPVEWTNGVSKVDQQAKAERAAAKAEREAKKLAKALLPDGSPLRLSDHDKLQTVIAAKQWLTQCASWNSHLRDEARADDLQRVLEALSAKTGDDTQTIWEAAQKRASKR